MFSCCSIHCRWTHVLAVDTRGIEHKSAHSQPVAASTCDQWNCWDEDLGHFLPLNFGFQWYLAMETENDSSSVTDSTAGRTKFISHVVPMHKCRRYIVLVFTLQNSSRSRVATADLSLYPIIIMYIWHKHPSPRAGISILIINSFNIIKLTLHYLYLGWGIMNDGWAGRKYIVLLILP